MTLRTLNYGNYGIFLIMGHAGFCPSTVWSLWVEVLVLRNVWLLGTGGGFTGSGYKSLGSGLERATESVKSCLGT